MALAVTAVVVGIATVTVSGASATSPTDDDAPAGTRRVHLVTAPRGTEMVVTGLDDGEERRIDIGASFDMLPRNVIGRYAVVNVGVAGITVVDLGAGTARSVEMPTSMADLDLLGQRSASATVVFVGAVAGGGAGYVDLATATAQPLGRSDSRYVPLWSDGETMQFADLTTNATLIVPLADPASAFEIPALGTSFVVDGQLFSVVREGPGPGILQRFVGGRPDGQRVTPPGLVLGGFQGATSSFVVLDDGQVAALDFVNGTSQAVGNVGFTPDRVMQIGRQRLFVGGESSAALLDSDGAVIARFDSQVIDGETLPIYATSAGTDCAVLQDGPAPFRATDAAPPQRVARLVDLDDGAVLVAMDRNLSVTTTDGCSAVAPMGGGQLVVDGHLIDTGFDAIFAVSPAVDWVVGRDSETRSFVALNLSSMERREFEPQPAALTEF